MGQPNILLNLHNYIVVLDTKHHVQIRINEKIPCSQKKNVLRHIFE